MILLEETLSDIKDSGHRIEDIVFIGSKDGMYNCTWEEFAALADREYDNGFGAQEVASDLIIVFLNGETMWREEYDGSEWWAYSKPFSGVKEGHKIYSLFVKGVGWESLRDIMDNCDTLQS